MEPRPPANHPLSRTSSAATLLNKYELGKLLGRGSFAKVYAARPIGSPTADLVAIKIIDKMAMDEAFLEPRLVSEVASMKRLESHPHILKIHEVMASRTKIYLVMELAAGGEIFSKILQRGRMKEPLARKYFHQLVDALSFCHQNGVAHRDVKPQNLLIDETGLIKVSDFGLSALRRDGEGLHLSTACGTPAFAAPEIFARKGYDGAKADAWSCGVMLFFFLAGSLPFDDGNLPSMYKKIQRRDYRVPAWISRPARNLIASLLDPNPNTRMTLDGVMKHAWFTKRNSDLVRVDSTSSFIKLAGSPEAPPRTVNAFDIISMSSGLDLSGLFSGAGRERRFTSGETVERVVGRVREVGERLGYRVEELGKCGVAIGLGKGRVGIVFEVKEIAEGLLVVEVRVVAAGEDGIDEMLWGKLKDELGDVVLQWHY